MRHTWIPALLLLLVGLPAAAQELPHDDGTIMPSHEAFTYENLKPLYDEMFRRIEAYTRLKFRRPTPLRVMSKQAYDQVTKSGGVGGAMLKRALAFYRPGINDVTVIPWNFRGKYSLSEWYLRIEPTLYHELTHAVHHQNFFTQANVRAASFKSSGLTEEELDSSTVDFLITEGLAELTSVRCISEAALTGGGPMRRPEREPDSMLGYLSKYQEDGKRPYRLKLLELGYQDGLTLMHHIVLKKGMRGIRSIMYRPPPRHLLFSPERLSKVKLDDPPEPDMIFGFLHPGPLGGDGILLTMNPGAGRFFESAGRGHERATGCLLGYAAKADGAAGGTSRYSIFVADPDRPGSWSEEQASSLRALNPDKADERKESLPLATKDMRSVKATVLVVPTNDGSVWMRAEAGGLVVMAHEEKPTKTLRERVLYALRALWIKRPRPGIYAEALAEAKKHAE